MSGLSDEIVSPRWRPPEAAHAREAIELVEYGHVSLECDWTQMSYGPEGMSEPTNWSQQPSYWSVADDAYLGAANLSARLQKGMKLHPIKVAIPLQEGEDVFFSERFLQYSFAKSNVTYNRGYFAAFGSPVWLAASLGGSALYNNYQRNKAAAQAAAQWRTVDQGLIHVTSLRICLQGQLAWTDIPLSAVRAVDALPDGVVVHREGQAPIKIATATVAYLHVLLSFLVTGQAIDVPLPVDFIERARRAGRQVPEQEPAWEAPYRGNPWQAPAAMTSSPWPAGPSPAVMTHGDRGSYRQHSAGTKTDVLGRPYADWGTRAVAYVIDFVVLFVALAACVAAVVAGASWRTPPGQYGQRSVSGAGIAVIAVSIVAFIAFFVGYHLMHGNEAGQTLGKRAVAIQVRDVDTGGRISYARAFGRHLAQVFAWLILPILVFVDLLWPLWDERLQALHDKAASTVVVRAEPRAMHGDQQQSRSPYSPDAL